MTDPDTSHLSKTLHAAVDDHVIVAPDLLPAAHSARGKRRLVGVGATVAAFALAGGIGLNLVQGAKPEPVQAATAPASSAKLAPATKPAASLSAAKITSLCQGQLDSYNSSIRWEGTTTADYRLARPQRQYQVGDVVGFIKPGRAVRYCVIPQEGQQLDPAQALTPTEQNLKLQISFCSEQLVQTTPNGNDGSKPGGFSTTSPDQTADLRGAKVLTASVNQGVAALVLSKHGKQYGCTLSSPMWDLGLGQTQLLDEAYPSISASSTLSGPAGKSIVDKRIALHIAVGRAPKSVSTIKVTGQVSNTITVTEGGFYAWVGTDPATTLKPVTYTAQNSSGGTEFTTTMGGPDPANKPKK